MHACLVGVKGSFEGTTVVLGPLVRVGRDGSCELQIVDDALISREHARLETGADGQVTVLDLFSRNGTRVNGAKVRKAVLRDGDHLEVGTSAFVFRVMEDGELARQTEAKILRIASGPARDLTLTARRPPRPDGAPR